MIAVWRIIAAMQRNKAVRDGELADMKERFTFYRNAEREEWVRTQNCTSTWKRHLLPGEGRRRNKVRIDGKKLAEPGALTLWRPHREGQVRRQKEINRARRIHKLNTTQGGQVRTRQNRPTKAHSRPGGRTERDKSGHQKKPTKQSALTS